eukprot:COSAG06_NODE_48683_length_330_cov_0.900433_1_plen_57_part_10
MDGEPVGRSKDCARHCMVERIVRAEIGRPLLWFVTADNRRSEFRVTVSEVCSKTRIN